MRTLASLCLFVGLVFAQNIAVPIPKEWKDLSSKDLVVRADFRQFPFLARKLVLSSIDRNFASLNGTAQDNLLGQIEESVADRQGTRPLRFLIWDTDTKPFCEQFFSDGASFQIVILPPLIIAVDFRHDGETGIADIHVEVASEGGMRFNIVPENFRVVHFSPRLEFAQRIRAEDIAAKVQSRARWGAAFTRMIGEMQTRQVTSQTQTAESGAFTLNRQGSLSQWNGTYAGGQSSTTTTTRVPDSEARARAEMAAQQRELQAAHRAQAVLSDAFRAQTVLPGQKMRGSYYFKKPKNVKNSVLAIPIEGIQFELGVVWQ